MLRKGGISGAPKGIPLSLSRYFASRICTRVHPQPPFLRSISTLYHPFGERTFSFSRAHARTHVQLSLPFSYTRSHSLAPAPFSVPGPSPFAIQPPFLSTGGRREPTERENRSSTMSYPNPNPSASPGVHTRPSGTHFPRSGSWVTATARSVLPVNRTQGFNTAYAIIVENVIKRLLFCEIIKGVRVSRVVVAIAFINRLYEVIYVKYLIKTVSIIIQREEKKKENRELLE